MAEYIDREAVNKMLESAQIITDGEYDGYCIDDISIYRIPVADVAPVVHGRWIKGVSDSFTAQEMDVIPWAEYTAFSEKG